MQTPQRPELSSPANIDSYRSPLEWRHLTDDWFGWRPWLDDSGLIIDATLVTDASRRMWGTPQRPSTAIRSLFDLQLTVDTNRLWGWQGGVFFLDFQTINGENGAVVIPTAQGISNIDADSRTQLPQVYFQQALCGNRLTIKVGKVDANSDFAIVEYATEFIHPSMGFSPTIFVMPSYPDPAAALIALFDFEKTWYARTGVFDGAGQRGIRTGSRVPTSLLDSDPDLFTIHEMGIRWELPLRPGLGGRLGAGLWHHNGRFTRFDGGLQSGTFGVYAVAEQMVYRPPQVTDDDERGIGAFFQYGYADPRVSPFEHHLGLGIACRGLFLGRERDSLGAGISWVRLSRDRGSGFQAFDETAVEVFYRLSLTPWAQLTTDLQLIHNPAGMERSALWIGTVRLRVNF